MNPITQALAWVRRYSAGSRSIVVSSRRPIAYPEVTGYFIPTLLALGEEALARAYAQWLVTVQAPDGSFGLSGQGYAFDTGQVIRGWVAVLEAMPELEAPLRRACNWLVKTADPSTGRLLVPSTAGVWSLGARGEVSEAIHLYTLQPLWKAGELLNEQGYIRFASRSRDYYLRDPHLTAFTRPNALAHFYAYVQEALVELGFGDVARNGMAEVARYQNAQGAVPAYHDVPWICAPGLAQFAKVWHLLGDAARGDAALRFLMELQNPSGGFFGSYGPGADYFPADEVSWTVKYVLDASQLQIARHFDRTASEYRNTITETDGRMQAIIERVGDLTGKQVLDAGCGKGRYAAYLHQRFPGAAITALDISAEMLQHVPPGIRRVQNSLLRMPFDDDTFDVVLCVEALEHAVQVEVGLAELVRVLAPSGTLIVIDKNRDKLGLLPMPFWERWFGSQEICGWMRVHGLEADVSAVGYDGLKADGLFLCWAGRKPSARLAQVDPARDDTGVAVGIAAER